MKDLAIYFQPAETKSGSFKKGQIGSLIHSNNQNGFKSPEENSVAVFFVPEYRNSSASEKADLNLIREKFYELYIDSATVEIYDLGTILPGDSIEDTYIALKDVVEELVRCNVLPLVIGGSQDLMVPIYQAYEKLEQIVNILDVDPSFDMGLPEDPLTARGWLNKVILHKPSFLFNYTLLGYQSYLVDSEEKKLLEKMLFDEVRLGEFFDDNTIVEPLARNADILSFDLEAIRGSDFRGNSRALPHGFYGEHACKIMRYAGISDKLTACGIFNYSSKNENGENDANLVAQMMWYFVEGVNQRKKDYPVGSKKNYTKFTVSIDDFKDEIIFYKSDKSSRWWMEVPYPRIQGSKYQRHLLIPCNYSDYENALKNEMPRLWWKTFEKLC